MGKQLDSLADVVSFGVAPGMIIYQLLRIELCTAGRWIGCFNCYGCCRLYFPCAAAWRLARFNLDSSAIIFFQRDCLFRQQDFNRFFSVDLLVCK